MELKQTGMMSYIGTLPATLSKHPSEINIQFLHGVVETLIVQTVTVCTITELEVNKCDVTDVYTVNNILCFTLVCTLLVLTFIGLGLDRVPTLPDGMCLV